MLPFQPIDSKPARIRLACQALRLGAGMLLSGWAMYSLAATPASPSAALAEPSARLQVAAHDKADQQASHKPQAGNMTAQQAAYDAQDQFGGRVLSVKLEEDADEPYYQVKLIKHGQVRVVRINTRH